jgi:hypothetical protein
MTVITPIRVSSSFDRRKMSYRKILSKAVNTSITKNSVKAHNTIE